MANSKLTVMRLAKHPCKARNERGFVCGDIWREVTYVRNYQRRIATHCVSHGHPCDASGRELVGPVQLTLDGCIR